MIILSGGGDPEKVTIIDGFFANSIDKMKKVVYIPIAMEKEVFTYNECYKWFTSTYKKYGITNIEMWDTLANKKIDEDIAAIFIGGGNTFKLLNEIKNTGFDYKLMEYISNGGIVYGGSAGAIIFGKSIEIASYADKNDIGLENLNGLNLFDGKDIWCHYSDDDEKIVNNYKNELIVLYEEFGIVKNDKHIISIGKLKPPRSRKLGIN